MKPLYSSSRLFKAWRTDVQYALIHVNHERLYWFLSSFGIFLTTLFVTAILYLGLGH